MLEHFTFSAGFMAVFSALWLCRTVDVYGFGLVSEVPEHVKTPIFSGCDPDSKKLYGLYYRSKDVSAEIGENECPDPAHPFELEGAALSLLHYVGLITRHPPGIP